MADQEVLKVQQGIWINEQWIRNAGLGTRLQVVVRQGRFVFCLCRMKLSDKNRQRAGKFFAPWVVMPNLGDCQTPPSNTIATFMRKSN